MTAPIERRPARGEVPALEIHRSPRRRRSASAAASGSAVVVRLPAGLPADEEERLISSLVDKVTGRARAAAVGDDAMLAERAAQLADRYLDGIRATSVTWSARMRWRDGSCTPATGAIRVNQQLASAPGYVLDHVLVHELAHLRHPDHSPAFHALVERHPHAARASGWLEGFRAGQLAAATPAASERGDDDPGVAAWDRAT